MRKKRPAIIVSSDDANKHLNRVQVVPLTSNTERVYPSDALVDFKGRKSKAMADQLTTVSKQRVVGRGGTLSSSDVRAVERALRVQLGLQ